MTLSVMESRTFGDRSVRVAHLPALTESNVSLMLDSSPDRTVRESIASDALARTIADDLSVHGHSTTRWGTYELVQVAPRPMSATARTAAQSEIERLAQEVRGALHLCADIGSPADRGELFTVTESLNFDDHTVRVVELAGLSAAAVVALLQSSPHRAIRDGAESEDLLKQLADQLAQTGRCEVGWGVYEIVSIAAVSPPYGVGDL